MENTRTVTPPPSSGAPGDPRPPVRNFPNMWPALIVVGLAVLLIGFGVFAGLATSGGHRAPPSPAPAAVNGSTLLAVPAAPGLAAIAQPGEPPANILDALRLPRGARAVSSSDFSTHASQFDQQVEFVAASSQAEVISFYRAELPALGWHVFSTGRAPHHPGAIAVLGKLGGDDGWYWDVGVTVLPTTFPTTGGGAGTNATPFTIRLIQQPDQD
jgi:hypothetical protein